MKYLNTYDDYINEGFLETFKRILSKYEWYINKDVYEKCSFTANSIINFLKAKANKLNIVKGTPIKKVFGFSDKYSTMSIQLLNEFQALHLTNIPEFKKIKNVAIYSTDRKWINTTHLIIIVDTINYDLIDCINEEILYEILIHELSHMYKFLEYIKKGIHQTKMAENVKQFEISKYFELRSFMSKLCSFIIDEEYEANTILYRNHKQPFLNKDLNSVYVFKNMSLEEFKAQLLADIDTDRLNTIIGKTNKEIVNLNRKELYDIINNAFKIIFDANIEDMYYRLQDRLKLILVR